MTAIIAFPLIVMGVSGSGKSTLGRNLAELAGIPFIEGDDFHPPANIDKMSAGIPLDDADRWPWLDRLAAALRDQIAAGQGAIASCSALRRAYRDHLRARIGPTLRFAYLDISVAELEHRLRHRQHDYMPASLLHSQLATLEPPTHESDVHWVAQAADATAVMQALRHSS